MKELRERWTFSLEMSTQKKNEVTRKSYLNSHDPSITRFASTVKDDVLVVVVPQYGIFVRVARQYPVVAEFCRDTKGTPSAPSCTLPGKESSQ